MVKCFLTLIFVDGDDILICSTWGNPLISTSELGSIWDWAVYGADRRLM